MAVLGSYGFGSTHIGKRDGNEDCFVLDRGLGLYVVADGMGGREGGEVASHIAAKVVQGFFRLAGADSDLGFDAASSASQSLAEARMDLALRLAHREVRRRQLGDLHHMGSTLVALLIRHGRALVGHAGDSRIYRLRDGTLRQMTRDHSFYADLVAAGVDDLPERADFRFNNLITRAVGMDGPFKPHVSSEVIVEYDRYLLCSDGLTDVVDDDAIATILQDLPPKEASPMLVAEALTAGARDNVTALVVEAT